MATFKFELVSPERLILSVDADQVDLPGSEGDFGVLAGHAPFMSTIRAGVIGIHAGGGAAPQRVFINGGFAEVNDKGLTILAEQAIPVAEIDAEAVARELANAREDIKLAKNAAERDHAEKAAALLEAKLAAVRH